MKFLVIILLLSSVSFAQNRQYLNGDWKFRMQSSKEFFKAEVPGTVHQDLMNVGLIDDIYFENNEHKYRWIENKNWEYSTSFNVDSFVYNFGNHDLVFEGLDTYGDVFLNDSLILAANNMFRTWRVDVHNVIKLGENELKVVLKSPVEENKESFKNSKYELPAGCEADDVEFKVSPYTRKAAYHFGWDWCPRIVTSGIYRDVFIDFGWGAKISDVNVVTEKISNDSAWIRYDVELDLSDKVLIQNLSLELNDLNYIVDLTKGENKLSFKRVIPNAKLWWPNGYGEAHLYNDTVTLRVNNRKVDIHPFRYGLRTIELINEPDSIGTSFYFKVNNQPIFVKGANYIPQDMLLPRVSNEQYKKLLLKAYEANMNMIRVWGGGVYEKDIFYDICDMLGIMVWQDFMFAGSMYPGDYSFLKNVKNEVIDNVKRIRKHPSVVIWCGNNEMEVAWNNWGWQKKYNYTAEDSTEIWNNYNTIFNELIPNELNDLDPERPYTSTSPISNWGTEENFNHSTMHYWGVWHGREPFENFEKNVGRFMVEYGFQSFPHINTLKKVVADSSLYLQSKAMKNRQKSYIGNGLIEKHIKQYYDEPSSFKEFVELSQRTQAKGMEIAIQAHRKKMGHCMGTMFWQLNDCWPGPSWSVIDYYGNEKLAYDVVKENYEEILIIRDDNIVDIIADQKFWLDEGFKVFVKTKSGKIKEFYFPSDGKSNRVTIDLNSNKKLTKALKKGDIFGWEF